MLSHSIEIPCRNPHNWLTKKVIILSWVRSILLAFAYFMVSNVVTLESVQSIAYALSLPNVSFSLETFGEITAALPLVGFCLFFIFFCGSLSWLCFCWQFDDGDFCCGTCSTWLGFHLFCCIGFRRALHFVLSCKCEPLGNARHDIAHQLLRQCLWLIWTMQLRHHVGW